MKPAKRIQPPKTCSIANSLTKRVNFAKHIAQGVFARLKSVIRHCALERYLRQLAPSFTPWVEFDQSLALNNREVEGMWYMYRQCDNNRSPIRIHSFLPIEDNRAR